MTRPMYRNAPQRRGFTLIELLVVIAIIAILASILFPVFAKARERAKLSACISNQKQLALATIAYADDYEGRMPYGIPFADGSGSPGVEGYVGGFRQAKYSWMVHLLEPYVKTTDIFQCPSDDAANKKLSTSANERNKDEVTYRFNFYATGIYDQTGQHRDGSAANPFTPQLIGNCGRPSEFALFRERFVSYHWKPTFTSPGVPDYPKARSPQAMADGSVKMRKGGNAGNDPTPWQYWNASFWWTGKEPVNGPH